MAGKIVTNGAIVLALSSIMGVGASEALTNGEGFATHLIDGVKHLTGSVSGATDQAPTTGTTIPK